MAKDITQWLDGLGLSQYAQTFADNSVELRDLPYLSEEDLIGLGLPLGHRRRLQGAIESMAGDDQQTSLRAATDAESGFSPSEADRRQLTVLFCDLVGSTELANELDPEDMRAVLRDYQDACSSVIDRYEGYIAKFMGDGVYAYFGYPTAHEDDAERAINAGLQIVETVGGLEHGLAVRIGIATGNVAVGDLIGEGASEEANVVGEAPNLAARLQNIAVPNTVVIGEATRALAGGLFKMEGLGARSLKGYSDKVNAWAVLSARPTESRFQATRGEQLTAFVGRDEELEILLRRWERTQAGDGQAVFISGEAGIGKSRLVHALRERIEHEAHYVRVQQSSPLHTHSALFPFVDQTNRAIGVTPEDNNSTKIDRLEEWLRIADQPVERDAPLIGPILGIDTSERYEPLNVSPQRHKELLFQAFARRHEGLSARGPFLYIVEDCHWLDPTSLELLSHHIERGPGRLRVLIVATFRPEFAAPWVGQANTTLITLNRLAPPQCATMISNISRGSRLSDEIVKEIAEKTDGVPLFVEELTKTVLEDSKAGDPISSLHVPASLQDSLEARLDRLGPAKEIAQIGAVIGRSFDYDLLSRIANLKDDVLNDALDTLVTSGLASVQGTPPTATYTFKHALVQDTAYTSLLRSRREELHNLVGTTLENQRPGYSAPEPEVLAYHFTEAANPEKGTDYWLAAGRLALRRSAMHEAIAHIDKGLLVVNSVDDDRTRTDLSIELNLVRAGLVRRTFGPGHEDVALGYQKAYELCRSIGDSGHEFLALTGVVTTTTTHRGNVVDAEKHFGELLRLSAEDRHHRVVAEQMIGEAHWLKGENLEALAHLERAAENYDPALENSVYAAFGRVRGVFIELFTGLNRLCLGYPDMARAHGERADSRGRELQHPNATEYGIIFKRYILMFLRDAAALKANLEQVAPSQEDEWNSNLSYFTTIAQSWVEFESGNCEQSVAMIEEAWAQWDAANWLRPWLDFLIADEHLRRGSVSDALSYIDRGFVWVESGGLRFIESVLWSAKGDAALALDASDETEAERCYGKALDVARVQSAKMWELRAATRLARLWHRQGRTAQAHDLLAPVYGWFTEGFDTADLKEAKELLDQLS